MSTSRSEEGLRCEICGAVCSTGRRLARDHNHRTGEARGRLCFHCNTGLGKLKDSPVILAKALRYLARHGQALETHDLVAIVAAS